MKISKKAENIRVTAANAGQRIDNFLMSKIKNVPKSHIHKIIRTGQTRLNGSRVKSLYKIKIDDIIRIPPYTTETKLTSLIKQEYKEQINKNICSSQGIKFYHGITRIKLKKLSTRHIR